jgi:ribonuclease P protein component
MPWPATAPSGACGKSRLVLPLEGRPGWDYVLVGRKDETASRDFALLQDDLSSAP